MEYDLTSGSSPVSLIKQYINSRPTKRSYNNAQEKLCYQPLLCTDPSLSSVAFLLFPLSIDALSAASLLRRSLLSLQLFVTILHPPFSSVSLLLRRAVSIVLLLRLSPTPSFFSFAPSPSVFSSFSLSFRHLLRHPLPVAHSKIAFLRRSLSSGHLLRRSLSTVGLLRRSLSVVFLRRQAFFPRSCLLKLPSVALPLFLECPSLQRKKPRYSPPPPKKTQTSKTNQINQSRPC